MNTITELEGEPIFLDDNEKWLVAIASVVIQRQTGRFWMCAIEIANIGTNAGLHHDGYSIGYKELQSLLQSIFKDVNAVVVGPFQIECDRNHYGGLPMYRFTLLKRAPAE